MATWRKVIVSGSTANLANVQVDGLTSGNVVIGGGAAGNLSTTAINGTGNIVATTAATGLVHSGSFSGSFQGNFVGTTNLPDLTQGTGITAFTYDGATTATVAVSGASTLNSNKISKWTGAAFADSSLTDNGTAITGTTSLQLTGASSNLTGSFSGSFKGDGSNLSGVTATAIFPTSQVSNITSTDKFFISQSSNQYITYGDLLTDLAGTNLTVEGTDSLTLATTITGLTSVTSTTFVGNLTGTATTASYVVTAQTASYVITAQTASYVLQAVSASFATNATNATNVTITDTTSGGTHFLTFTTGSSGTQGLRVDSNGPTVNPSQNSISATSFTGSLQGTATTASYVLQAVNASFATLAQTANTASYVITAQTASYVNGNIFTSTNPATSASYALSSSFASTSPAGNLTGATLASNVLASSLTSVGTLSSLTATNAVITNNLTVQGTASFQNTTNLEVADRFVLFASGSNTTGDGGIVVQQDTQNVGELFAYENSVNRWGFTSSFNASSPTYTAAAYITTTEFAGSNPTLAPTYGSSSFGFGNIYVNSSTGDIFIYS